MSYLSKLTKRLAVTWASIALLAACAGTDSEAVTEPGEPGTPATGVASVRVTPDSLDVRIGMSHRLVAEPRDQSGRLLLTEPIIWTSSDPTIAVVDSTGTVTALREGDAEVRARSRGVTGRSRVRSRPEPVATVTVTPSQASLEVNAQLQLTAEARSASDSVLTGRPVVWRTSADSVAMVDTLGRVTARGAGSALISAEIEGRIGTAAVAVTGSAPTPTPAPVASVTLTPATASIMVGQAATFTATLRDANGTVLTGRTVSWSSTNPAIATVASSGIATGVAAGSVTIRATSEGTTGQSALTVVAPTPPPPGTILIQEGFEDDDAAARGWYDNVAAWTTTTAEHRPTGSRSLAWTWAAGAILPTFGGAARREFAATPQVYVSYWVKYSSNWIGSGVGYHPHEFYLLTNANGRYTGPSFTHLTTYIEHLYGPTGGIPRIGTSDGANIDVTRVGEDLSTVTEARATAGCNGNTDGYGTDCYSLGGGQYNNGKWLQPAGLAPAFLPTPGPGYKGDWHRVEVFFRMNTIVNGIGQADGVAQYWFDGQLLVDQHDVLYRTGQHPNLQWTQFLIGPYIGVGSPVVQSAWIDDLLIMTARP
jgi:uncharacterized protein YjdB